MIDKPIIHQTKIRICVQEFTCEITFKEFIGMPPVIDFDRFGIIIFRNQNISG